jgi:hypothetical protein
MTRAGAIALLGLAAAACGTERTEYHYRPDYVAINQGRPLEETYWKPDGTKVVITSKVPGLEEAPPPEAPKDETAATAAETARRVDPNAPPTLQLFTADMVLETFMGGLREQNYALMYGSLVSPQQRERMGGESGRAEFVKFCETNRRELMASSLRLVSSIRSGAAVVTQVSADMTRYQLPEAERENFGFTMLEVERTPDGLRLAGVR